MSKRPNSQLLIDEPPLQVLPSLAVAIGLNEAIFLQQVHYWITNPKIGKSHEGRKWVRNSLEEWHKESFRFWSMSTLRRAITSLEKAGLLLVTQSLNLVGSDRTGWYTIDYEKLMVVSSVQNEHINCSEWTDEPLKLSTSIFIDSIIDSNVEDIAPAKAVATSEAVNPQIAFSGKENQIVTAQSEKKPQPSKSALEKNPPSAAPPPLAKTVQPHIALIDAWLAALPAKPIGNQYNRNVRVASEMHKAGVTPAQITAYVTELYTDVFWQKQTVSMEHIAKNIPQWLTKNAPGKQQWYTHPDPAKRGLRLNEAQYNAAMKERANAKH